MFFGETAAQRFLKRLEALKEARREQASGIPKLWHDRFTELAEQAYKIDNPGAAIAHVEQIFIEANSFYEAYPDQPTATWAIVEPAMFAAADCLASVQSVLQTLPSAMRSHFDGLVKTIKENALHQANGNPNHPNGGAFIRTIK